MTARAINTVLAVLVLLAGAAAIWAFTLDDPGPGTEPGVDEDQGTYIVGSLPDDDGHDAVVAAVDAAELALAWDYRRLDQGLDDATARMTDEFAEGFRDTFEQITRPRAKSTKAVVDALVQGAGEVEVDDDEATVLVFVNQVVVDRRTAREPTIPYEIVTSRVYIELERVDDEWLVDAIGTLGDAD